MDSRVVSTLLPTLVSPTAPTFNIFDVMRHGTHEKQISNVFAWLLDSGGTHDLGDLFQGMFVVAVNRGLPVDHRVATGAFGVRQEVNTADAGAPMDIADIVLEDENTVMVIENYYTSDGHEHRYDNYLRFGEREGKRSVVVMLCAHANTALLTGGWENSTVVEYADLVAPLFRHVQDDSEYDRGHPAQVEFFRHLQARFVKDRDMDDNGMMDFIEAMCSSGQARHYRTRDVEEGRLQFADGLRQLAFDQFAESRAWLQRVKSAVKNYAIVSLVPQLEQALGEKAVSQVDAKYAGIYQWSINIGLAGEEGGDEAPLQLKFGPSAWFAHEGDAYWERKGSKPDYSRLFLTRNSTREIRQSSVTLREVLDGLDSEDFRLRDEFVALLAGSDPAG